MKKKLKSKLILLLVGLASLFLLGGCSLGTSLEEILDKYGAKAKVTYYANGGKFDRDQIVKEIYYTGGMNVLNVGKVPTISGPSTLERNEHDFAGWYYAELDNDGKPVYEDEKKGIVKVTDDAVEFPLKIDEGQNLYFAAKWEARIRLDVYLVCDAEEIPSTDKEDNPVVYKNGEIVGRFSYTGGYVTNPGTGKRYRPFAPAEEKDFTFIEYYMDAECTQPVVWPIAQEENQTENGKLYAKYIAGEWNVIRSNSEVAELFTGSDVGKASKKFYLARDVDMTAYRSTISPITTFACRFEGNGYTIRNLNIERLYINTGRDVSMFGNVASTAVIKDVTFENVSISYSARIDLTAYFTFTSLEQGATVEKVKLTGEMKLEVPSDKRKETYLYGNKDVYASDEAYLEATKTNDSYQFFVEETAE